MREPRNKEEVLAVLKEYKRFIASSTKYFGSREKQFGSTDLDKHLLDMYPKTLNDPSLNPGVIKFISGSFMHAFLLLIAKISQSLNLWLVVASCAKIRILTDGWSSEPRQCGYNLAYTRLGLYRLRKNNIEGAIKALHNSCLVWPCPHNTSFGLSSRLANALEKDQKALHAVAEYREIAREFKS